MTEMPQDLISEDDVIRALRLVMKDSEITEALAGMRSDAQEPARRKSRSAQVSGFVLSDDLLLLLSVESEELCQKVDRIRREDFGITDEAEQREWDRRRANFQHWLQTTKLL